MMWETEQIDYDEHSNVLYISSNMPPRPGIAEEVGHGVYIRVNPDTDELVGITILDFKKDDKK